MKNNILREYVVKQPDRAESIRYFNYPIQALEETITNAYYHRDYSQYEPVTITVEPNGITVTSIPGLDRSISQKAIEEGKVLRSRRYRNRRLGDFLKELDLTEGRATGVPTIQTALQENGSPRAEFITDDIRSFTDVFIPVHESIGKSIPVTKIDEPQNEPQNEPQKLSVRQTSILNYIKSHPNTTRVTLAAELNISLATIKRELKALSDLNLVRYKGSAKSGRWVVIKGK